MASVIFVGLAAGGSSLDIIDPLSLAPDWDWLVDSPRSGCNNAESTRWQLSKNRRRKKLVSPERQNRHKNICVNVFPLRA